MEILEICSSRVSKSKIVSTILFIETILSKKTNKYFLIIVLMFLIACQKNELCVKVGEQFLTKHLYYKGQFPGGVMNIQLFNIDSADSDRGIIIFGRGNYIILDLKTKKLKKAITFKKWISSRPEAVNITKDDSLQIMLRGGGFGEVGLVDTYGDFIWKYKHIDGASPHMTAGDLDKDGQLYFYVADLDGLCKLDYSGKQIWRSDKMFWERDIQIYNPAPPQTPLIFTRGDDGNIRFWNKAGRLVKEVTPEIKIYGLEILSWPDKNHVLTNTINEIIVMGLDGRTVLRYKLGKNFFDFYYEMKILDIRGVPVRFEPQNKPHLAVITDFSFPKNRAMLSIFSPEGELVYQEMLYSTRGINVIDNPDGSESLLVGDGAETVWIYQRRSNKIER
jgi:hypothetical protein